MTEGKDAVWAEVCLHINDAALGPLVTGFAQTGVADALLGASGGVVVRGLAENLGLRQGLLHLASRVFELQGWASREEAARPERTLWRLTGKGREILQRSRGAGEISIAVAAAMARLYRSGVRADLLSDPIVALGCQDALAALEPAGWSQRDGGLWTASDAGRLAIAMAPQFLYVDGYRALFSSAAALLQDTGPYRLERDVDDNEGHVDRAADIAFSGLVFARNCRAPFLTVALPLFDNEPPGRQPRAVVDTGAGDGTLLIELYHAIRNGTRRGRCLAEHPLTMVAAELSAVARGVAAARLEQAEVPHLVVPGDIGAPDALAETLSRHGIDMADALHVNKSVIHNRSIGEVSVPAPDDPAFAGSLAVHLDQAARPMTPQAAAGDLIAWFARWRPWTARHGMVAIEAHAASPQAVQRAGATPIPATELSHGLSLQHLVEPLFHRRAAELAGYERLVAHDLQSSLLGEPLMTCDHLMPGLN
ncbi:MAG: MarR family winged helix-turn-helix transcriptional regulator [Proteobacteria bacterium]|nr:MarR family winged helix-turn-helix transcriptional regulator [Pseudomonadota bacterium]MDA1069953.1 MarR family winged helix-turn-helix transcriptional regulator [Pseudomonadota bacterium]